MENHASLSNSSEGNNAADRPFMLPDQETAARTFKWVVTEGGVSIGLPKRPYAAQVVMMRTFRECLIRRENACIQSPTGTGKTLASLSSSIATRRAIGAQYQKVVTHENGTDVEIDANDGEDFEILHRIMYKLKPISDEVVSNSEICDGQVDTQESLHKELRRILPGEDDKAEFRVFFLSRTNSQVSQVLSQLRKTEYSEAVVATLASRKELCVRKGVRQSGLRNEMCLELLSESECAFYNGAETLAESPGFRQELRDIEDLRKWSEERDSCAYYASRRLVSDAEIVLANYNYILDPVVRKASGIDIRGDALVFDEAHNLEGFCRSIYSMEIRFEEISCGARIVEEMLLGWRDKPPSLLWGETVEQLDYVAWAFVQIWGMQHILSDVIDQSLVATGGNSHMIGGELCRMFEGDAILDLLQASRLSVSSLQIIQELRDYVEKYNDGSHSGRFKRIENLAHFAPVRYFDIGEHSISVRNADENGFGLANDASRETNTPCNCSETGRSGGIFAVLQRNGENGKVVISERFQEEGRTRFSRSWNKGVGSYLQIIGRLTFLLRKVWDQSDDFVLAVKTHGISLNCLNPAIAFKPVAEVARRVILMSGTLAPMQGIGAELETDFQIVRDIPGATGAHKQVLIRIAARGSGDEHIRAIFRNYTEEPFKRMLLFSIAEYVDAIPGGVIVFFPSYAMLRTTHAAWEREERFLELRNRKAYVGTEPQSHGNRFQSTIRAYKEGAMTERGSLLLAVHRGKVSEGVDFPDDACRGVILVGIPFLNRWDHFVSKKANWNRRKAEAELRIKGSTDFMTDLEWYNAQAFRSVNQAAGRVIRHAGDFGTVILMDERYADVAVQKMLSGWIRNGIVKCGKTSQRENVEHIKSFFAEKKNRNE